MINYGKEIQAALKAVSSNAQYELFLQADTTLPCITWQESNNYMDVYSSHITYSFVEFTVKVWALTVQDIYEKSLAVDAALTPLGFERTSTNEMLVEDNIICRIMKYRGFGKETLV